MASGCSSYPVRAQTCPIQWDVDVYKDGEWVDVFNGVIDVFEWKKVTFAAGIVTKTRIRGHSKETRKNAVFVREVDFHDATAPSP